MEAVYTYDAVKVYALSIHKILQRQGDICNGTDVVQTIINMGSYPSDIQGINVSIQQTILYTTFISLRSQCESQSSLLGLRATTANLSKAMSNIVPQNFFTSCFL